eukprot:scaffold13267_cov96-Isochrysis_galbana.AAC.2
MISARSGLMPTLPWTLKKTSTFSRPRAESEPRSAGRPASISSLSLLSSDSRPVTVPNPRASSINTAALRTLARQARPATVPREHDVERSRRKASIGNRHHAEPRARAPDF